ncbi:glycosyltransferase family 39 protein [Flammeovirgaceae bacterium SG7u.111]|nr:glycosyltransferase family 39 protein [Flammeovirgaceae bacterium SG7u.132]WPO34337.1 glycosyltransferase family 39 protein [Flammeovirgaceae bacterium SG7u.111]
MKNKEQYIIFVLAILNIFIHLLFYDSLEYHRDELLYFSLGRHLDLGYASVPPLIGWIAALVENTIGFSVFAVKLVPALLSGVMVVLFARIAKELGGNFYAQVLAVVAFMCTPFSLRAFFLYQPVCFDVFFWTLVFYLVIRYINTESDTTLYWLGAAMGIALLNKYLIFLQLASIFVLLSFTPQRKLFRKKAFYISLLIAFVIFLPNLYWQISNDLPVLRHMSELNERQLVNVDRLSFVTNQLFMWNLSFFIALLGLLYLLLNPAGKKYGIVASTSILVFATLMYLQGKAYYAAGIFPVLLAAGAVFIGNNMKMKELRIALFALLVIGIIPLVPFGLPVYSPDKLVEHFDMVEEEYGIDAGRTFEDGKKHELPQDYADMLGWEELALVTKKAFDQVENKEACAIYCENYGQAGAVTLIGKKYGLPEALSFSDAYEYWLPRSFEPDLEAFIYINDELGEDVAAICDEVIEVGGITNPLAREYGTKVYLCRKFKGSFNGFWGQVMEGR